MTARRHGAEAMEWYLHALKQYATFTGRASRKEYWYFVLFNILAAMALFIVGEVIATGLGGSLYTLYLLGTFLPSFAVSVRRLHDIGKSGWWLLVSLIPLVGTVVLLVLLATASAPGANTYGPKPDHAFA